MRRARVSSGVGLLAALGVVATAVVIVRAADDNDKVAPGRHADQEALKAYAPLVGSWRGVGQVARGKSQGFWRESADWAWKLTSDSAGLEITVKTGKYLKAGVLRPGKAPGTFVFEATLADGTSRTFAGEAAGERKRLVLTADAKAPADGVRRVSIDPLHDNRVLVLLEAENPERHTFSRLGEVGYTREGVAFAVDESYPLCVVTEGRGTIQVKYKGKTYWVCCTGCRDLFKDNPSGSSPRPPRARRPKQKSNSGVPIATEVRGHDGRVSLDRIAVRVSSYFQANGAASVPRILRVMPRLPVVDLRLTITFYQDLLGFNVGPLWPADEPSFALLERDDVCVQFYLADRSKGEPIGNGTLSFDVDDATAMHGALRNHVAVEWGPEVYWYGRREFAIRDPSGYLIIFSEPTRDAPTCQDGR